MKEGDVAFIGASAENHGVTAKISNSSHIHGPNLITVSYNGSVGEAFYQTERFWASDDINVLYPKFEQTEKIALYMCSCLRKTGKGYGYNFKWSKELMEADSVTLPITRNGKIDFHFMEARIQEMEEARIQEMNTYLKVTGFENCELTEEERKVIDSMRNGNVKFSLFPITDSKSQNGIFDINNSHNILQSSIVPGSGNTPYVTAGEGNNSISSYVSFDRTQIEKGNAIMIGGKTMVITYQSEDFFSNDSHNLVLYAKEQKLRSELVQLYMVASLNKSLKPIYSWGDSISKAKIRKDKFHLPVTVSGEIDHQFMETYIRAQEKLAIQRIKNWRAKEIEATKDVVNAEPNQPVQEPTAYLIIPSSDVAPSQRYITHLPVYPLSAACGYFDKNGSLPDDEAEGWIDVSAQMSRLDESMFIVHAEGRSMEPMIHDGDLCVFSSPVAGSRQGKIVLVKAKDNNDPEASSFTIKKYSSKKSADEDGVWHHTHITLSSLNPEFQSIELDADETEEGGFGVYGELVKVLDNTNL